MILDKLTEFSDAQSLVGTGNVYSAKVVDTGAGNGDDGIGHRLYVVVRPVAALAAAAAATVEVNVETSDASDFSSGVQTIGGSGPVDVTAFKNVAFALPRRCKRYLRLSIVRGGSAITAGTINANLALDVDGVVRTGTGWKF